MIHWQQKVTITSLHKLFLEQVILNFPARAADVPIDSLNNMRQLQIEDSSTDSKSRMDGGG